MQHCVAVRLANIIILLHGRIGVCAFGADGDDFALSPSGGLSPIESRDFEAPDDAGSDGTCEERLSSSDGDSTAAALVDCSTFERRPKPSLARLGEIARRNSLQ